MIDDSFSRSGGLSLAARVVSAYVSNNKIGQKEIGGLLTGVYKTILAVSSGGCAKEPAVPINASVTRDYIVCLEDGQRLRMLKRYLRNRYNLSPQAYRAKWGLPADYPMNAPGYSKERSKFAREIGLGRTLAPKRKKRKARAAKSVNREAQAAAPAEKMIAQSFNGRRILSAVAG